jgi:hypothetical protein
MPTTSMSLVEVGSLAITRAMLGVGVGLLVADRLEARRRQAVGRTLLAVGVITTVPVVVSIMRGVEHSEPTTA